MRLASNPRTATPATIKRASAQARASMNRLDRAALRELEATYKRAVSDIQLRLAQHGDAAGNLRLENLRDIMDQVNNRLDELYTAQDAMLGQNLSTAADIGVRPFAQTAAVSSSALMQVSHDAVQFVRTFSSAGGLQLSDRLWRLDNNAKDIAKQAIESAVIQGHSATQAAREFISRGVAVPVEMQNKINNANAIKSGRIFGRDLMTGEGNPLAQARKLFRTEINRAHGEAYMAGAEHHPDTAGFRYLLSPNHPQPDICDMHASVNLYGLGPGVYPSRERCPWPAHPNTLSYVEIVFSDEITATDKAGKETRIEWLKKQTINVQDGALGSRMKRAALHAGHLKENEIATPWNILKPRYQKRGINLADLTESALRPPVIMPHAAPHALIPDGAPVSTALNIIQHKRPANITLAAIDKVHGDGRLPIIPVSSMTSQSRGHAVYVYTATDDAYEIRLLQSSPYKEHALAHEIGHFIDHKGFPGHGFSSPTSSLLNEWRMTAKNSDAVARLNDLLNYKGPIIANGRPVPVNIPRVEYLLDWTEIWARSYAQYVTIKSGNATLMAQLNDIVTRDYSAKIGYVNQWQEKDFEPIAHEIDKLFSKLGWLKNGN